MELRKYLEVLWRRKWIFLVSFVLCFGIIAAWTFQTKPIYNATAKVMLIESSNTLAAFNASLGVSAQSQTSSSSTKNYDTEIALMKLNPLLETLIRDLNLKNRHGKPITAKKLVKYSLLNKFSPQPYLEVSELEDSDILEITSYSANAPEAAQMSNRLAELYVKDRTTAIQKEYQALKDFLEQNITQVERKYKSALAAKSNRMIKDKSIDLGTESKALIDFVETMEKKMDDYITELAGKTIDLKETHADIIQLNRKIETVKKILEEKAKTDMASIPLKQMRLTELDTVLAIQQDLYQKLFDYLAKLSVAESITLNKNSLVDFATVADEDYFPKKPLMLILGLIAGLSAAIGATLLVEHLDTTIRQREEIQEYGLPILGQVAKSAAASPLLKAESNDVQSDSYWHILWNIQARRAPGLPLSKLLVSSSGPQEGRTSAVVNLGALFAQQGRSVLLIDADMHRPFLHRLFALPVGEGLTDILSGRANVDTTIHASGIAGVSVLTRGTAVATAGILFASQKMRELVNELGQRFDILIFDSAPLLMKNDALLLSQYADDTVLVVRSKWTTRQAMARTKDLFCQARVAPAGIIFNGVASDAYYFTMVPLLVSAQEFGRSLSSFLHGKARSRKT
jgi:tyrosine-protein kinase Etk/Wzc